MMLWAPAVLGQDRNRQPGLRRACRWRAGAGLALVHRPRRLAQLHQTVSGLSLVIVGGGLSSFIGTAGEPGGCRPNGADVIRSAGRCETSSGGTDTARSRHRRLSRRLPRGGDRPRLVDFGRTCVRAVGEDPAAADAAGIPVVQICYLGTMIGGSVPVSEVRTSPPSHRRNENGVTAGAGWIAVARHPRRLASVDRAIGAVVRHSERTGIHPAVG